MPYILVILAMLVLAIVFGVSRLLAPPSNPPEYTDERPEIATDGYVAHTEEIVIDVPLKSHLEWSALTPLKDALKGKDDLPSVVRTEMIQGEWANVGARRRVVLSDGHFAAEEVLANDNAGLFRYEVWGYTNFARFAVDYAVGEFRQTDVGGKTHIMWTYSFHKHSVFGDLFLDSFVQNSWAAYMRSVLVITKAGSEKAAEK